MSDFKSSIKIEIKFMGVEDKYDGYINYCSGSVDGVDDRIIEFFQSVYERGMLKYNGRMIESKKKEEEIRELELYKRLKEKYA